MKLLKVLFLVTGVMCLPLQSFAGAGAHGGNLNPGKPVSAETVKAYLEKVQIPVELSYKYMSVAYHNDQGYFGTLGSPIALGVGKLLYRSNPNIFTKIRSVKPTIVEDGSCKINGVSMDGAAYTKPDRICLDAARIAANPKVGDQDMALVSVALAAHEYSHLVGTSEEQADLIQDYVQRDISEKLAEKYSQFIYSLNRRLDDGQKALAVVLNDLAVKADWAQVCTDLTSATDMVGETLNEAHDNNNGIGFFSRDEYDEQIPNFRKASTFEFACKKDAATNALRDRVWGSEKSIPDAEYIKRRFPNDTGNIISQTYVPRMDYGDVQGVGAGVEDLIKMVSLFKSELPSTK